MRRGSRAAPTELVQETAELDRERRRLERLLVASGPILAAVASAALGLAPAWLGVLVAAAAIVWMLAGLGATRVTELDAAREIDHRLTAKETFLTWTTVPEPARGPLWPVVAERASETARGKSPRRFAAAFAWRAPLASLALSVVAVALLALFVELRPVEPTARLLDIADRLDAPGRDAASRALAAELRELARKLADPNVSAEEKRELAAEMRQKLEQQQKQQGGQGKEAGQSKEQKGSGQQSGATAEKGEGKGEQKGQQGGQQQGGGEAGAAAAALGEIEKELAGESPGEKESQAEPKKENGEKGQGGGIQGPSEGQRAGEKPGEGDGNQPGPKNEAGKSEQGEGEGGRQTSERPEGQQAENPPGQRPKGDGSGEGEGASGKPSPSDDGQKAEKYYKLGDGPDALRVEDGQFVKVLVPEQGGGVGTERVQKPGEAVVETPFGNAPLPSEGPPGAADERQPVPLEYRPILRK
jgi:hypothetical protein